MRWVILVQCLAHNGLDGLEATENQDDSRDIRVPNVSFLCLSLG